MTTRPVAAPPTRSFPADRLDGLLEALVEMAARAENADPIPFSDHRDELDAIAYLFNVLLTELKFASDAKSAFLRTISHEIRTPATVLVGNAALLARSEITAEERKAHADRALRAGNALLGLVDNVLDLARIESGTIEVRDDVVDLPEIFADLRATFTSQAASRGLTLEIDGRGGIPAFQGDPGRVRQVLVNLVGNAVKYTTRGGVEVRATLRPDEADRRPDDDTRIVISVTDTGPGIDAADRDRLFELYGRGSAAATAEGTGLGLHLARRLAGAMNGEVELDWSVPGQGSRFTFSLPFVRVDVEPETSAAAPTPRLAGRRVLVVDDSFDIREVLRTILELEGATTVLADNGDAAVELALDQPFDLVLMDVRMPGASGLEIVRALRGSGFDRPVVALTADPTPAQREECLAAGFDGYLAKPIGYEALVQFVARFGA